MVFEVVVGKRFDWECGGEVMLKGRKPIVVWLDYVAVQIDCGWVNGNAKLVYLCMTRISGRIDSFILHDQFTLLEYPANRRIL